MTNSQYKKYLLIILLMVLAFNYVDRIALGLVLQDIKVDLALSDTQLGFLSGIGFALFYSVMGIPIARWADRGNRVTIIGVTTALWSAAVMLCGMAGSLLQLILIRIVVGVGEAGCVPPANSLIADSFTRAERPRAASVYMLGTTVGLVIGYLAGGWLNELYGWRAMFIIIGLPGLALSALVGFSLREPRRIQSQAVAQSLAQPSLKDVCVTLWTSATFRHMLYASSLMSFFGYAIMQWTPAFFVRSFGVTSGALGTWFALIYGVGGILGTYLGGEWVTHFAAHNERLQLKAMAIEIVIFATLGAFPRLSSLAPNEYWAFGWLGLSAVAGAMIYGPMLAVIQTLMPPRMRAMSIAILTLFANLIGVGLGPLAAGALSDALRPSLGEESLRYALLAASPGYLWVSWHFWKASRTAMSDIAGTQPDQDLRVMAV